MPPVGRSSVVSIRTVVVLPAPFGPEEAVDLALGDLEVDAVDGLDAALELALQPDTSIAATAGSIVRAVRVPGDATFAR